MAYNHEREIVAPASEKIFLLHGAYLPPDASRSARLPYARAASVCLFNPSRNTVGFEELKSLHRHARQKKKYCAPNSLAKCNCRKLLTQSRRGNNTGENVAEASVKAGERTTENFLLLSGRSQSVIWLTSFAIRLAGSLAVADCWRKEEKVDFGP